ncbi:MAG TPA: superoxide dismutase [Thermoguttaceae bacterium]|nr:superoxide dismutase [Thermoguttaceae bacterium]
MKRRRFLAGSLAAGAGLWFARRLPAASSSISSKTGDAKMPFQQPPLPFPMNAMKPFLSEEQLLYHYGKHHAAYFKNLNDLVQGKPEAGMSLDEVVVQSTGPVFNNAAQAWNHGFFWDCLSPDGGGEPGGELAAALQRDFGDFAAFRKALSEAAVKLFGSGWAWLAADRQGKLSILPLGNADTPLKHDKKPVLTIDVWEHAYYIDYRNERAKYVEAFWKAVHWEFAARCYASATA